MRLPHKCCGVLEVVATCGGIQEPVLLESVDHWLGVLGHFGVRVSASAGSSFKQVREALRQGVMRSAFEQLRTDLGVSTAELAEILGIPTRTLVRRTDRFKPDESERILSVHGLDRRGRATEQRSLKVRLTKNGASLPCLRER
jgi:putative aminopeptidase FrvX